MGGPSLLTILPFLGLLAVLYCTAGLLEVSGTIRNSNSNFSVGSLTALPDHFLILSAFSDIEEI